MIDAADARRKRLLYQAQHRGFKEADLVVGGFAAAALASMNEGELDEFERLLAVPDHDLFAWITKGPAPAAYDGPVMRRMQAFDIAAVTRP